MILYELLNAKDACPGITEKARAEHVKQAIDADPVISFARDKFGGEKLERDEMNYDQEQI